MRQRRKQLDLTREALAYRVGCADATIKKIESGLRRPSRQMAELILGELGIAPSEQPALLLLARTAPHADDSFAQESLEARQVPPPVLRAVLPRPRTPLLGRDRELTAIAAYVTTHQIQLITVTGPPGVGKTRLAIEVAHAYRAQTGHEVLYVALEELATPALVLTSLAHAIGVQSSDANLLSQIVRLLAGRTLLCVLDTIEHSDALSPLLNTLIGTLPELQILVTSRNVLGIYGEQVLRLPPLDLPDTRRVVPLTAALQSPAVALFSARARAADGQFTLDNTNCTAVCELCVALDGIPLAVELVAAQVALLTPAEILNELQHGGQSASRPWQQRMLAHPMRAAIERTYQQLHPASQLLFCTLGVFHATFTLDALEQIVDVPTPTAPLGTLALDLVQRSLLTRETIAGRTHFRLLRSLRDDALERLRSDPSYDSVLDRHARYYVQFAEAAQPYLLNPNQDWLTHLEHALPNIRAAVQWSVTHVAPDYAYRFVAALWPFWRMQGTQHEGLEVAKTVFGLALDVPLLRANAYYGAAWLALDTGDLTRSSAWFSSSLDFFRTLQDLGGQVRALQGCGLAQLGGNNAAAALIVFNESLKLCQHIGDRTEEAWTLLNISRANLQLDQLDTAYAAAAHALDLFTELQHQRGLMYTLQQRALLALYIGDFAEAARMLTQSLTMIREYADRSGMAITLRDLGRVALFDHDDEQAEALLSESAALSHEIGLTWCMALCRAHLASIALHRAQLPVARALLAETLGIWQQVSDSDLWVIQILEITIDFYIETAQWLVAATILSAITHIQHEAAIKPHYANKVNTAAQLERLHAELDDPTFARAFADGVALTIAEVVQLARAELYATPSRLNHEPV
jgi:predicted ATPase/transcriptional regulator with XRE-family HTH domain